MEGRELLLEMVDIQKQFPGVLALNHAQLKVRKGTAHALMGENGAGKSTLMKILLGIYQKDGGKIFFKGREETIASPEAALKLGISMIHQELTPILDMRVCENVFLGREPVKRITRLVDEAKLVENTKKLLASLGITGIEPQEKMRNLSIAQWQMIEIAKAFSYNSDLIIMDEPTSAISEAEIKTLFKIIRQLKARGISIIYISHKIDEIYAICDEITVFRDGSYVGTDSVGNMPRERLFTMMVDRDLSNYFIKSSHEIGEVFFETKHLTVEGKITDVNLSLRRGEILGIAGLVGAGRTEIVETIFGLHKISSGEIYKNGKQIFIRNVADAIENGIALASEDRKVFGLCLGLDILSNITICNLKKYCNRLQLVKRREETKVSRNMIDKLKIKTPSMAQYAKNLSGGNQQKIVLAKWLLMEPDILILDEPTRGIDVGAKSEIYAIMDELTRQGKSIIMISSEMPEVIGMSDRVLVVREGKVVGELQGEEISQERIIQHAAG